MNCIHELNSNCYDCNGGDSSVWPKPHSVPRTEHHYDLLDPETARVILKEIKIAEYMPPSGNGCPSEHDYWLATQATLERAYDDSHYCEECNEARTDFCDEEFIADWHVGHMNRTPTPPAATQVVAKAGRKAMLADIGQYL